MSFTDVRVVEVHGNVKNLVHGEWNSEPCEDDCQLNKQEFSLETVLQSTGQEHIRKTPEYCGTKQGWQRIDEVIAGDVRRWSEPLHR